ncbi:Beta-lactamase precursor [Corynebacterium glaucum]|uniref:serine hydrolase domain-containing protein n=1 Tax=Corynebacterium glaucum TaxID=187491 RepID=UPI0025B36DD2|nr:serine hydrolase domain-containing protein [Corynebacterium glaucum]WJZ07567.1 Beta-lactamase precursor [Corynebacterium glaucum]
MRPVLSHPIELATQRTGDPEIAEILATCAEDGHRALCAFIYEAGTVRFGGLGADEHTEVEIGSITKTFNAELVRQLVSEGALAPRTTVGEIIDVPDAPIASVTLEELLDHTSGLGPVGTNGFFHNNVAPSLDLFRYYCRRTPEQVFATAARARLRHRRQFLYSNFGHALVGQLLAVHQKTNYEALVRSRIFEPAGMSDTYIALPGTTRNAPQGLGFNGRPVKPWEEHGWAPAGAAHSTAADMAKYAHWVASHGGPGHAWHQCNIGGVECISKGGGTAGYSNVLSWDTASESPRAAYVANSSAVDVNELDIQLLTRLDNTPGRQ